MKPLADVLRQYDYELPKERIAQEPADPRDSARLAVLERKSGKVRWTRVREIVKFLPKGAVLVLNETKVVPARLAVETPQCGVSTTTGKMEILVLGTVGRNVRALASRRVMVGERLWVGGVRPRKAKHFTVLGRDDAGWILRPSFSLRLLPALLRKHGTTPLPPYIKRCPLTERQRRTSYQSVFAKTPGSVAAPTASLHLTPVLLRKLRRMGVRMVKVTLHVNLGTFAPLTEEQWKSGKLHHETYSVPATTVRAIQRAKKESRPVIAVGTTVARTLETVFGAEGDRYVFSCHPACVTLSLSNGARRKNVPVPIIGTTDLFIREGYRWKVVDGLLTNFHVPRSSLLMLVCAFAGRERVLALYNEAVRRKMRFFSFGDGMLIV